MNRRQIPQIILGSLLTLALVAMGGAFYEWYATGVPDLLLFVRIGLVLLGLLVLYTTAAARQQPDKSGAHCARCGAKTFETLRSLDRKRVDTCFVCGAESLVRAPPVAVRPRPPMRIP